MNNLFFTPSVKLKDQNNEYELMEFFDKYILQQEYRKLSKLGDRLAKADELVDWEQFRPIVKDLYVNDTDKGGRPNTDKVCKQSL